MNFPVFIFHVWDAATPFSVFPVQRGEDHSDKFRGGSVSLKNPAYTPALTDRRSKAKRDLPTLRNGKVSRKFNL